jgi:hypothetical protein
MRGKRSERDEVERTSADLGIPLDKLHAAVKKAKLGTLSTKHWSKLTNSESYKATPTKARRIAKKYDKDLPGIIHRFKNKISTAAPIVLHRKGEQPYLVAGNTRLAVASGEGIRPKVLHVRMKK